MHLQVLKRDGFQIAGYCCEVCSMMQIIDRCVLYVSLHGRMACPDSLSLQQFVYSWYPGEGTHMSCDYLLGRADLQQQSTLSLHWQWQSSVSGKRRKRKRRNLKDSRRSCQQPLLVSPCWSAAAAAGLYLGLYTSVWHYQLQNMQ